MTYSIEQGFKDAGIRAIADKIKTRLHDLDKTVDSNKGRWAWELLQNAKDSVADTDRKVSVQIELSKDKVEFRHNGKHFNEHDIIGIINQISSKEVGEGEKSKRIGRFGTGFLTTHLLSKVIDVKGIFESNDGEFFKFNFLLDRNEVTTEKLIPKIEKARKDFLDSIKENKISKHNETAFNTSFIYQLDTPEKKDIARVGIDEFSKLIPFVLASISTIYTVEIIDKLKNSKIIFENNIADKDDFVIEISKTENNKTEPIKLIFAKNDDVSISALLKETEIGFEIENLNDFPKLFCDFPLIGTEDFYFPVIVNSFDFTPRTERNGIWLKKDNDTEVKRNREILEMAIDLYKRVLPQMSAGKFVSLYNFVDTRQPKVDKDYFDDKWFEEKIQTQLREFIVTIPIVDTVSSGRIPISEEGSTVDFPLGANKRETERIWELANIEDYFLLPQKKDIHFWNEILWTKEYNINEENILEFVSNKKNIEELKKSLKDRDLYDWLNKLFEFTIDEKENVKVFDRYACLPNQKGVFNLRTLISNDEILDDTLKQVSLLLGEDYYNILLHPKICFKECASTKHLQDISTTITNEIVRYRKSNEQKEETKDAIRILSKWFDENEKQGDEYFSSLFRIRERLLVETIDDKINLYRILSNERQLASLAQIAEAMNNDPELINFIEVLIKERKDFSELQIVGEFFEQILMQALTNEGFDVEKVIRGRDLIIKLTKKDVEYSIEVKSTKAFDFISMTDVQGKTACENPDNYALCVIHNNGTTPDIKYVKDNAKLILDIGKQLKKKVAKGIEFEQKRLEVSITSDDIILAFENGLNYNYQISNKIWGKGKSFEEFIKYLCEL